MSDKNKITIPISDTRFLVYRETELGGSVLLVDRVKSGGPGDLTRWDEAEQYKLATSAVMCAVLGEALTDMARQIRKLKK